MTTCSDFRDALIDLARPDAGQGGQDDTLRSRAEAHVAACPSCAAELDDLRATLDLVRGQLVLEPLRSDAARLMAAVDAELARTPAEARPAEAAPMSEGAPILRPTFGDRVRGTWEYAQWRYESSRPFRRFVLVSLGAHAAAVLFVGWLILDEAVLSRRTNLTWDEVAQTTPWDAPISPDDANPERPDDFEGWGGADAEDGPARFEPVDPAGVRPDPSLPGSSSTADRGGAEMRFPTVSAMLRYRAVFDDEERQSELRMHAGRYAESVDHGIGRALEWLASRRRADGTWAPTDDASTEVRIGVTSAVVLAFANGGRSSVRDADAERLAPAVAAITRFVETGHAAPDVIQPLYPYALALRALAARFVLDYPDLDAAQRSARREMLDRAGRRLIAWQHADGGFGYAVGDERTDSSCTLFAAAALADLRVAGVLDTRPALARAGQFLEAHMRDDGILDYRLARDRDGDLALTAGALALHRDLALDTRRRPGLLAVKRAMHGLEGPDALLLAAGTEALRRHHVPIEEPVEKLVRSQRENGSWDGKLDRHLRQGGDELATAYAVIGLSRTYVEPN